MSSAHRQPRGSPPRGTSSRPGSSQPPLPPVGFAMPTTAAAHLFEPEREPPVGDGRDYEGEMRQLEAQADALRAEADRIDLKLAMRECTNNVARATESATSSAACNVDRAMTKIHDQQERFKSMAVAQGVDLDAELDSLGLRGRGSQQSVGRSASNIQYSATRPSGGAEDRLAALRARATARAVS
mgnify:FL=1